jgi:hypothetical protein
MFKDGRRIPRKQVSETWNKRFSGKPAFNVLQQKGYLAGELFYKGYKAHRIAWAIQNDIWPSNQIDHINGDPADNRISNLREVDNSGNQKNRSLPKQNKSGHIGVHQRKSGSWRVQISSHGKYVFSKTFKTYEEACEAQKRVSRQFGFAENHGRSSE